MKFYNMEVAIDENLETECKGLYVIGDGSGVTHSLSHASASGVYHPGLRRLLRGHRALLHRRIRRIRKKVLLYDAHLLPHRKIIKQQETDRSRCPDRQRDRFIPMSFYRLRYRAGTSFVSHTPLTER